MGRSETAIQEICQHKFPLAICLQCAARTLCIHGFSSDCLLCAMLGSTQMMSQVTRGDASRPQASLSSASGRDKYPWIGKIIPSSARLRREPSKSAKIDADPTRDTEVTVTGASGGWLHVQVTVNGKTLTGYISQELVRYVRPVELSLREALVLLKRAETQKKAKGVNYKPSQDESGWSSLAVGVVNGTGKYTVDETTYTVSFKSSRARIKIDTIEDFILFVEEVERQYPTGRPATIATEIRQVWFSDENWEMLSAGMGVESGGGFVDIETRPNPIALKFDMGDLSPSKAELAAGKKNKRLATAMGAVDISHVIAGLDTRLNGFPTAYPANSSQEAQSRQRRSQAQVQHAQGRQRRQLARLLHLVG